MELKELYAQYGELAVQAEILQNRLMKVKQEIATELNKGKPVEPQIVESD